MQPYGACARITRRILVDAARKRSAARHGGGLARTGLSQVPHNSTHPEENRLIALDDALNQLREAGHRKAEVVELRYFGGLSVAETAAVLKVSEETVTRDWRLAAGRGRKSGLNKAAERAVFLGNQAFQLGERICVKTR